MHVNGNWMNDDQRSAMRAQAEAASRPQFASVETDCRVAAELLAEGRKVLGAKAAAEQEKLKKHAEKLAAIFGGARIKALELLRPLGAIFPVLPGSPDAEWNPWRDRGHLLTFYVRPFATGRIEVRLQGSGNDWNSESADGDWTWRQQDDRWRFYVARQFTSDSDFGSEVWASLYDETDSLAEALALCERHSQAYREAIDKAREACERREEKNFTTPPNPAQRLLTALEDWYRWMLPE